MFSIIIPLYNKAGYISRAVASVLAQTFPHYELLIVNDGSTDNSLDVVRKIEDARIRIIDQPNAGVAVARNNGVKAARFGHIVFLDADDRWDPRFLEEMAELIRKYPEAGIYGCRYYTVKNGKNRKSINHESPDFQGYIDYFRAYTFAWWMPLTSISVVIPIHIYRAEKGFKPALKYGEDFELWVRIALKHKVAYTNQPLAFYNQDVPSADRALGGKLWKKEENYIFNLDGLEGAEKNNEALKQLLDGLRVRALLRYYLSGKYPKEVAAELRKVDFSKQPFYFHFIYKSPLLITKAFLYAKKLGSTVKQGFAKRLQTMR